jgi:3-oxoacyl-[acyl-carrier-protein] synthase II
MKSRIRVVVTGVGVVSPIGIGKRAYWKALLNGSSGAKRISSFEASTYPTQVAGEICDFDPSDYLPIKEARRMDRSSQMILASTLMALEDSRLTLNAEDLSRFGVFTGTAVGGQGWAFREYEIFKEKGAKRINPFTAISTFPNATSAQVSLKFGMKGPSDTISSGCVSSTIALGYAVDNIRLGRLDVALVGGTEAPIEPAIFGAYCAARVMTSQNCVPTRAPRPFDLQRDGILLSEGAAVLVCENLEHALSRGARIYAEVAGWSHNCDAYHMVLMNPEATQPARVMREALADSGLTVGDLDYVQAHGAGTVTGDRVEAHALHLVLGEATAQIPVVSIKSMLGHTQGACGAIESVAAVLSIKKAMIPPSINCDSIDPECWLAVNREGAARQSIRALLMNTFGFGGKNAAVVFRALTADA